MIGIIFFISLFFASCKNYTEKEIVGFYAPVDYKNNFDTIQLQENNIYHRKVYDFNKKLVLEMQGEWKLDGTAIKFYPFYLNLDDDLVKFPENVQDTTGGWAGDIWHINEPLSQTKRKAIAFCVGHQSATKDENCYQKIR